MPEPKFAILVASGVFVLVVFALGCLDCVGMELIGMRSGLNGMLHWIGMLHWSGTKSGLTETVIRKPAEEQQTSAVTDAAKVRVRRLRS